MKNTKKMAMRGMAKVAVATGSVGAMLLAAGCGGIGTVTPAAGPVALTGPVLHGTVFGGRQPIAGAAITLYAASTASYGGATPNILTSAVTTTAAGGFNITSKYTCTPGQQIYIVSMGGDSGAGSANPQAGLMAALGDCSGLSASTFINMNEVTTVASAFALSPFMTGYANVGSTASNTAGLARAMNSVNKLANIGSGYASGPALPAGATAPVAEIYTVADILAACVNTTGGTAGDNTTCGTLFSLATPNTVTPPTDTIGLALMMAKYPTQNVGMVSAYATPISPYQPALSATPTDWTMSIKYTGFSTPASTTIDGSGRVWVANSGNNTVSVLSQSGAPVASLTGNGLTMPVAVAIDASGDGFVANKGGTTVSAFTSAGATFGASPFTVGTAPVALALDASGNVFVANSGSNNISKLNGSGVLQQTLATGVSAPSAIAINPK